MPTLDDLHAVFTDLEQRAPLPQPLPSTDLTIRSVGGDGARRGGVGTVVLAASAVVAVAAGVTIFANRSHTDSATGVVTTPPAQSSPSQPPPAFAAALPASTGSSPQLRYGFAVGPVAGYRVTPVEIDSSSQVAEIQSTDLAVKGELQIYYAGAFDPTAAKSGAPVTVNGRPGYYTRLHLSDDDTTSYDALAWEYAPGGWAVVDLWDGAAGRTVDSQVSRAKNNVPLSSAKGQPGLATLRSDELRIATASYAADTPVWVPIKITGLTGNVTDLNPDPAGGGLGIATDGLTWDFGWGNSDLNPADKPNTDTTTFEGRTWLVYHDKITGKIMSLGVSAHGFGMTITPLGGGAPLSDYQEFLAHVSFPTDPGNPDTWFDAETALP